MILRPYGLVRNGELDFGLEVVVESGVIVEIRMQSGLPDPYILSPAFVNAHSHLEYRSLQGVFPSSDYWTWIRGITAAKRDEAPETVRAAAHLAAEENRRTGVGLIWEHSDRPYSGAALRSTGIHGVLFQEVITLKESPDIMAEVEAKLATQRAEFGGPAYLTPHAPHTVSEDVLRALAGTDHPLSIHVAESTAENEFFQEGRGPIADFYASIGLPSRQSGERVDEVLERLGFYRPGVQFVHGCDLSQLALENMAKSGVSLAHCPRSNRTLQCPIAPIRAALDAGVRVGLGMDSAASSGPIDMFAEMRAAYEAGIDRSEPITAVEILRMATTGGAQSLGVENWDIAVGSSVPLIQLRLPQAQSELDLIEQGSPECVTWVS